MSAYATILADPPWLEQGGGKCKRGADKHYALLRTRDIPSAMMSAPQWQPAPNAHLYLWTTNAFLPDALFVMRALGFRYVTNVAWVKEREGKVQTGLGQYFRGGHELLLFGVRGSGKSVCTEVRNIPSVIKAPRGEHSRKPDAFYEMIEARSTGPYLEMFARGKREGWKRFGLEAAA